MQQTSFDYELKGDRRGVGFAYGNVSPVASTPVPETVMPILMPVRSVMRIVSVPEISAAAAMNANDKTGEYLFQIEARVRGYSEKS